MEPNRVDGERDREKKIKNPRNYNRKKIHERLKEIEELALGEIDFDNIDDSFDDIMRDE